MLGANCASAIKTVSTTIQLDQRPSVTPDIVDNSPIECPECSKVNGQNTFKITERDFSAIKIKLLELDDYSNYLIKIIEKTK